MDEICKRGRESLRWRGGGAAPTSCSPPPNAGGAAAPQPPLGRSAFSSVLIAPVTLQFPK